MDKKVFTVYMHIFPNMKIYIGLTSQRLVSRWANGKGYKYNRYMDNAINKYGWENIEHIIIADKLTKKEACKLEIDMIKYWNATNSNNGYNLSAGGENGSYGSVRSEEFKRNLSMLKMGNTYPLGIKRSDEANENNRQAHIGIKHTEETKRQMSIDRKGKKQTAQAIQNNILANSKAILQYDLEGNFIREWIGAWEIKKILRINNPYLSCKGIKDSVGGFIWRYKNV